MQGKRIASQLMERCLEYLRDHHFEYVALEVDKKNGIARQMYERRGFTAGKSTGRSVVMGLILGKTVQDG